jgi:shikimate kinase
VTFSATADGAKPPRIVLIGPRGSGKTSVARVLAQRLNLEMIDADVLLEQRAGQTIREIFVSEGEKGFRDRESALLRELLEMQGVILAMGGGVVVRPENRALLCGAGPVVWLTATAEVLWQRIVQDTTTADRRPNLLQGGSEEIAQLLTQREPWYRECATVQIDTADKTTDQIVESILAHL